MSEAIFSAAVDGQDEFGRIPEIKVCMHEERPSKQMASGHRLIVETGSHDHNGFPDGAGGPFED